MKFFLVISCVLVLMSSCFNQEKKQQKKTEVKKDTIEVVVRYFKNNPTKVEYEIPIIIGTTKCHGIQKRYYDHGSVYSEIPYVNGIRHGIAYTYYKEFKGGKPSVWKKQTYENGKLNGPCWRYYESGKLQAEYFFKDGLQAVGLKEYSESGQEKKFPPITVNYNKAGQYYYVTAQLGDIKKDVTFYRGDLIEGKYIPENLVKIQDREGLAELLIPVGSVKKEVTIVAVYSTRLTNQYIAAKTINL